MLIAYTGTYLLLEMSHHNYIPFHCLTSNILKENWVSCFLLLLLVMCKTIPRTLQAADRWQISGLVKEFVRKLSGLTGSRASEQSSRSRRPGLAVTLCFHSPETLHDFFFFWKIYLLI